MALANEPAGTPAPGDGRTSPAHPIEGLMKTAMESIKGMIDVNTVVGNPVQTPEGATIIPISRVTLGFAAGGGDYGHMEAGSLPFGGGSGAGVTVQPVGFLVVNGESVRLLAVNHTDVVDAVLNYAPQIMEQLGSLLHGPAPAEAGDSAAGPV
ncbi:Uncharacterized spore protein YtfJ [Candidatus Hydrogenisulfobacillus filiaventi]|uniref:Uncharacterized spore protein YtfJ n=1 Tax=Candidatus Hydrogenisulfobacillus filiaventi TaxID=2707344 RepID=A0A6F8ZFZ6_9FIRM|nr:GerW family sporulation protein [Bacillota bacterium]CAB1128700.1 Uncharacterized spore protein YtfJ [Candidatus Hydrogenisulfobacillus filiaventi]